MILFLSVSLNGCSLFSSFFEDKPYGQFTIWADGVYYPYLNDVAKKFMQHNKLIEIEVKLVDSENYIVKYLKNTVNKSVDIPSAVVLKGSSMLNVYKDNKDSFRNVNSEIFELSSSYTESRVHEVKINKNMYGIPLSSSPMVLVIDEKKLIEYGYTKENLKTWEEVCTVGSEIYSKSNGKDVLFKMNKQQCIELFEILVMQLKNNDEYFYLSDYNSTISRAKLIINNLKTKHALQITEKSSNSVAGIGTYKDIIELSGKNNDKEYVITNVPAANIGGNTFVSGEGSNLIVTEQSENISGLVQFLKYLSTDKNAIEGLKEYNIFPALRNVYNIKLFDKKYSAFNDDKVLSRLSSIALKEDVVYNKMEIVNYIKDNYDSLIGK